MRQIEGGGILGGAWLMDLPEPEGDISATEHYAAEIKATIARGLDAVNAYIATDGYLLFVHADVPRNTRH